jgi:hypothetical protein
MRKCSIPWEQVVHGWIKQGFSVNYSVRLGEVFNVQLEVMARDAIMRIVKLVREYYIIKRWNDVKYIIRRCWKVSTT